MINGCDEYFRVHSAVLGGGKSVVFLVVFFEIPHLFLGL